MEIKEARDLLARARASGTLSLPAGELAQFNIARDIVHAHRMATESRYARGYHEVYSRLARAVRS